MGSELGVTAMSAPRANTDKVGIFWITWCCAWTVAVASGMAFLISRRDTPLLRLRGLGLSLSAITLLHLYWISVQLGYVLGPLAPGDAEFWIMGLYLPFGIALFHASNTRFLHVAKGQRKFIRQGQHAAGDRPGAARGGLIARFRRFDYTSKIILLVSIGMVAQVSILT